MPTTDNHATAWISAFAATATDAQRLWHRRLGHASVSTMTILLGAKVTSGMTGLKCRKDNCVSCQLGKSHRAVIGKSIPTQYKAKRVLECAHADLLGPITASFGGCRYMLLIVDEYSRYVSVIPIVQKNDTLKEFTIWLARHENRSGLKLSRLHTDNGGEFKGASKGIHHDTTMPYTPEHIYNGIVESMKRTNIESHAR